MIIAALLAASAQAGPIPPVYVPPPGAPPIKVVAGPPMRGRPLSPSEALYRGVVQLSPEEAVMKAAAAYPRPVIGVVQFTVHRAEAVPPNFFLNSEDDYRDQRNISIRIVPMALPDLRARFGPDLAALLGRKVRVVGPIVRTRIDLTDGGMPTGKYYYQTHEIVTRADQIELTN